MLVAIFRVRTRAESWYEWIALLLIYALYSRQLTESGLIVRALLS